MKYVLTIAGSDPSGGAGIQADLRAFAARGVGGLSAITAVTAQTRSEVRAVHAVPVKIIVAQIDAAFDDCSVSAVKTGMLLDAATVCAVADALDNYPDVPLVVDPVVVSSSGTPLLDDAGLAALREHLLPRATVITPNLPEAGRLTGIVVDSSEAMREAAEALAALGTDGVVITGGHAGFAPAVDGVWTGDHWQLVEPDGHPSPKNVHGTGCRFSASVAAGIAKGEPLVEAVRAAKAYVGAILSGATW